MATLGDILLGLAEQIDTVLSAVTDVTIHVEGRAFPSAELPAIDFWPVSGSGLEEGIAGFQELYGGIPLMIRVRVSPADIYAGEDLLLRLMDDEDPLSVVRALDYDHTVGGLLSDLSWGNGWPWTGYEAFPDPNGGGDFLGSRLPIIIIKAGS